MEQSQVAAYGATQIAVGLSAIIRVKPNANQYGGYFKINGAAGGSLEVVPLPIALTGTSAAGWGAGYLVGTSEVFALQGPATFYLAATGATIVIAFAPGYTSGVTLV